MRDTESLLYYSNKGYTVVQYAGLQNINLDIGL